MHSLNMILAQRDLVQTKVRNLAGLEEYVVPDRGLREPPTVIPGTYETMHIYQCLLIRKEIARFAILSLKKN